MISSYYSNSLLKQFGLDEKEAAIYTAALQQGQSSQVELAEASGIKRTTVREYIAPLVTKGLLQQVVKGKRTEYIARDPRELLSDLKTRVHEATDSLPALLALQKDRQQKPVVRYFEGLEGLKQVYDLSINVGQPLASFLRVDRIDPELKKWVLKDYLPRRHKKKIPTQNIVNGSDVAQELTPENTLRENRVISTEDYPFDMEVFVFADYVAYMHYQEGQELYAVLIQSSIAANTMRSVHKALWDRLG
jgi:predicted transcriptional regulator